MAIENIVEKIIWENIDNVIERKQGMCCCETCKADIAAFALNHLKPRYVATEKGAAITRAEYLEHQFYLTIIIALTEAVEKVSANPRHR